MLPVRSPSAGGVVDAGRPTDRANLCSRCCCCCLLTACFYYQLSSLPRRLHSLQQQRHQHPARMAAARGKAVARAPSSQAVVEEARMLQHNMATAVPMPAQS